MTQSNYRNATSLRQALDAKIRHTSTGAMIANHRQRVVFERFYLRLALYFQNRVVLKGGLALLLRNDRMRATTDIDIRLSGNPDSLLNDLRAAARQNLQDFLQFTVVTHPSHPTITNDAMQYDGQRFRVTCLLDGKQYGNPFDIDIAFGDIMFGGQGYPFVVSYLYPDILPPPHLPHIYLYPLATHLAEKLHAYTMPRSTPNSRVKDLPDLALMATLLNQEDPIPSMDDLAAAFLQTFQFRKTHPLPLQTTSTNLHRPQ